MSDSGMVEKSSLASFTPGPWIVHDEQHYCGARVDGPNGRAVAHSIQRDPHPTLGQGITQTEAEANARLIAAAPDLYDAADNALNALIGCCVPAGGVDDRKTILEAQAMLRAALAKATGEQS